jgi:hypothetical protein
VAGGHREAAQAGGGRAAGGLQGHLKMDRGI